MDTTRRVGGRSGVRLLSRTASDGLWFSVSLLFETAPENNDQGWAHNIAYVLAHRGEFDRAFEWLARTITDKRISNK